MIFTGSDTQQGQTEGGRQMGRLHFLRQIQATRLGGAERIVRDDIDQTPRRYAHICESGIGTTVHTTDDRTPDAAYSDWKHVGIIDLDTGDLVEQARV